MSMTTTMEIVKEKRLDTKKNGLERTLPTIDDIRRAVPDKCFEKSVPKSIYFLAQDYVALGFMVYITPYVEQQTGWTGLLACYIITGLFGTALFTVGHDCGHESFSNYSWLNDLCGNLAHAPLLWPFWPWQKFHRPHHTHTAHLEKDKGHIYLTEDDYYEYTWFERHCIKLRLYGMFRWNPIYTAIAGMPKGAHWYPSCLKERIQFGISMALCVFCAYIAFYLSNYSIYTFFKYYYAHLLFHGFWNVIIIYLQHQDEDTEVYEEGTWNFVKGQIQTIDRVFGFGIDWIVHHMTDGHVAHHLFNTKIPHYNLPEATEAIVKILAPYNVYKKRSCYNFVYEFLKLDIKLEYLVRKGAGILKYDLGQRRRGTQTLRESKSG